MVIGITSSITTDNKKNREFHPEAPYFHELKDSEIEVIFNKVKLSDKKKLKRKERKKKNKLNDELNFLYQIYKVKLKGKEKEVNN